MGKREQERIGHLVDATRRVLELVFGGHSAARSPTKAIAILVFICLPALSGCAVSFIDSDGRQRIIGLVDVTVPSHLTRKPGDGAVTEIRTIGVSVFRGRVDSHIALGYHASRIAAIPPNSIVHFGRMNPFGREEPAAQSAAERRGEP